jgi:hypothetical protein
MVVHLRSTAEWDSQTKRRAADAQNPSASSSLPRLYPNPTRSRTWNWWPMVGRLKERCRPLARSSACDAHPKVSAPSSSQLTAVLYAGSPSHADERQSCGVPFLESDGVDPVNGGPRWVLGAIDLVLGFQIKFPFHFSFDLVLILSNPDHPCLIHVVETIDLNKFESTSWPKIWN